MLKEFQKGNFSVRRVPGKFNHLPPDQFIKQTVNQNQKAPGGIIKFLLPKEQSSDVYWQATLQPDWFHRWKIHRNWPSQEMFQKI